MCKVGDTAVYSCNDHTHMIIEPYVA